MKEKNKPKLKSTVASPGPKNYGMHKKTLFSLR
jgi:hypothetical protein